MINVKSLKYKNWSNSRDNQQHAMIELRNNDRLNVFSAAVLEKEEL